MKKNLLGKTLFTAALVALLLTLFTLSANMASLPGDMNGDGKVSAADARIVLRIAVGLEKVEDYMKDEPSSPDTPDKPDTPDTPSQTEEPKIVNLTLDVSITDDGYFVAGESTATITVTADQDLAAAELKIVDGAGDAVFTKSLSDIKKNQPVNVEWDGKNGDKYVPSGDYTVIVTVGETESKLEGLNFTEKNYFSDGNGSESNPFLVSTKDELEQIVRYPKAYYKQIKDIDYDYESTKALFTQDAPFNGTYDGDGKTLSNITSTNALIDYVGKEGTIKNVTVKNGSFTSICALVKYNSGKISQCTIEANVSYTGENIGVGVMCSINYGTIANCSVEGTANGYTNIYARHVYVGGITGENYGKIISCTANVYTTSGYKDYSSYAYSGGIAGYNKSTGVIQNSEASGNIVCTGDWTKGDPRKGGIAGYNDGQITNSIYTGSSEVSLSGGGSGIVA